MFKFWNRKELFIKINRDKVTYFDFCSELRNDRSSHIHDWFNVCLIEVWDDGMVQAACLRCLKLLLIYVPILVSYCAGHESWYLRETLDNRYHLGPHFLQNASVGQVYLSTSASSEVPWLIQTWMVDQDLFQGKYFDCCLEVAAHFRIFDLNTLDSLARKLEGHIDDVQAYDTADV